jgi:hypothetical protein
MYVPHEPKAVLMLIHMVIFVVTLSFEVTKLGRTAHNGYFYLHST